MSDSSFSPAFRRTVLVSLRRSGALIDSPYRTPPTLKEGKRLESGEGEPPPEDCAFTKLEIRQVIRYTEDCCNSTQSNGCIDFQELESVFRRAHRARAAAKFEEPGRHAVLYSAQYVYFLSSVFLFSVASVCRC